jgi:MinD-like ATPase involved in chromosome partitioning or flagellar assembly
MTGGPSRVAPPAASNEVRGGSNEGGTDSNEVRGATNEVPGADNEVRAAAAEVRPSRVRGALLAVCGLCGGAGASTLAYLLGRHIARAGEPVLVCDAGGSTGGLAVYAGVRSPRSLPRLADAVARREDLAAGLFADGGNGLRVIAGDPEADDDGDSRGLARILADARGAHSVTIADCGTLSRRTERQVLAAASHVAWVVPVGAGAVRRGRRVLALVPAEPDRPELLVARQDVREERAPLAELRAVAGERRAPLVLMPHVDDLAERDGKAGLERASLALDAIAMAVAR